MLFPRAALLGLVAAIAIVHGRAYGADGVRLLKQPNSFPITIDKAGSYRLKSNILVSDANTTAIVITADDVTLDLNGFAIIGPTMCTLGQSCSPTGTGMGISSSSRNVTVRNGTVRGMGSDGVALILSGAIEGVRARGNGRHGIRLGGTDEGCRIVDNDAQANGGDGIQVDDRCLVRGNTANYNGGNGIRLGDAALVIGNVVSDNGDRGILAATLGSGDAFIANMVTASGNTGIESDGLAFVNSNAVTANATYNVRVYDGLVSGNAIWTGSGTGIRFDGSAFVTGNAVDASPGFGLVFGTGGGYSNNALMDNNGGSANPQLSGGTQVGVNLCGIDTSCP